MSIFKGFEGGGVADVAGIAVPFGGGFEGGLELDEIDCLPLTWPEVETLPNALTPSDFTVGPVVGAGEMGDDTSSIDPNVTAEPYKNISVKRHEFGYC